SIPVLAAAFPPSPRAGSASVRVWVWHVQECPRSPLRRPHFSRKDVVVLHFRRVSDFRTSCAATKRRRRVSPLHPIADHPAARFGRRESYPATAPQRPEPGDTPCVKPQPSARFR